METNKPGASLSLFLNSLKEIESVLAGQGELSPEKGRKAPLPLQWREVVYMARMAPALIDCVKGCQSAVDDILRSIKSVDRKACGIELDELQNLSDYCARISKLADTGATPDAESIH